VIAQLSEPLRLLLVDDDEIDRRFIRRTLAQGGLPVELTEISSADHALEALQAGGFDCALFDYHIPGRDGLWLLRAVRAAGIDTPVVMLTGRGDEDTAVSTMKSGAADYLAKSSLSSDRLIAAIRAAIRVHLAERDAARALEALAHGEERLRIALHATELGIWDYHPATGAIEADARAKALFDLAADQPMTYELLLSRLEPDDRAPTRAAIERALDPEAACDCDVEYRVRGEGGGPPRWVRAVARAFAGGPGPLGAGGPEGAPSGGAGRLRLIGTVHDVSARRAYEDATRRQSEFEKALIGIVSHDLRNPLQAMIMAAHAALRRGGLDPAVVNNLGRIVSSGERAARMIADLLDFTRARAGGGLPLDRRDVDLHDVARQTVGEVQETAPDRTVVCEAIGDGRGDFDPDRLAQLVTNLVVNALGHGAPGSPVAVRSRGEDGWVTLEVHNRGAIAPDLVPTLFEPFSRGERPTQTSQRSIGLGLYIVKQIVIGHGGAVELESTAERGTTFRVRLPR
jgi:signal transduction histidine kinase